MFGRFKRGDDPVKDLSQMAVLSMTSSLWCFDDETWQQLGLVGTF